MYIEVVEVRNTLAEASMVLQTDDASQATTATFNALSLATLTPGSKVYAVAMNGGGAATTPKAGYTEITDSVLATPSSSFESQRGTGQGDTTPEFTAGSGTPSWIGYAIEFSPNTAAAGGTGANGGAGTVIGIVNT
jgi:hypothetical protein